jgi:hypothetical protein
MRRNLHGEDGIALVTGLLVTAVVLILAVSALSISIHNTDASGYDRRRLQSIDGAEAGIDAYYAMLSSTRMSQIDDVTGSTSCVMHGTLSGTPSVAYTVTPTFYTASTESAANLIGACPHLFTLNTDPKFTSQYVVLRSVGVVAGQAAPQRTMTAKARLSAITTSSDFPAAAIYADSNATLSANIDLYSASGRNDANVYAGGSITVTTRTSIRGSLYVQGNATIANGNFWARGDVWANGYVNISGGRVDGSVISSTSTDTISGNTYVNNATAAGAINVTSPPAHVYGTQSPFTSGIGPPPSFASTLRTYTWNAADWPNYVNAASCAAAQTDLNNWTTGNLYIRLTGCATFTPTTFPKQTNLPGNLGIISDGSITLPIGMNLATSGGPYKVFFMAGITGTCGNFTANSNSGVGANLKTFIYTPTTCTATMESNSSFSSGQIFSGNVIMKSNAPFTFEAVSFPGTNEEPVGALVDPVYRREVATT